MNTIKKLIEVDGSKYVRELSLISMFSAFTVIATTFSYTIGCIMVLAIAWVIYRLDSKRYCTTKDGENVTLLYLCYHSTKCTILYSIAHSILILVLHG